MTRWRSKLRRTALALTAATCLLAVGCTQMMHSKGGGQVSAIDTDRRPNPAHVAVPQGYRVEVVASGLTFPTGVTFDAQGRPCVTESGYSYGEVFGTPRLVRIEPDGHAVPIASGEADTGPWTGVQFHDGAFYVAEGGERGTGGRIVRLAEDGTQKVLIDRLPSLGDHHTNGPVVSSDGWVYFGIGTATNSGVVGPDNAEYGWLIRHPDFHDIPAKDVTLAGQNFESDDPLKGGKATTGAYVPFGTPTQQGQVIPGHMPCNGAILRVRADGSSGGDKPDLVAWGLRNPFGLALTPAGQLYVTENQFDVRGSRPIWGAGDVLWKIDSGLWYGWPDFHAGEPVTWSAHYKPPGKPAPQFLLAKHPNPAPKPAAVLGVHNSACGFDFARGGAFGHDGEAFVALFGDMSPAVGKVLGPVGFEVVRVDLNTGVIRSFAVNRGKLNGPASLLKTGGLERPIAARFDPSGKSLYVVDFGILTMDGGHPHPVAGTGVLWRVTREGQP